LLLLVFAAAFPRFRQAVDKICSKLISPTASRSIGFSCQDFLADLLAEVSISCEDLLAVQFNLAKITMASWLTWQH
jgi:hypothetical protein